MRGVTSMHDLLKDYIAGLLAGLIILLILIAFVCS